MQAQTERLTIKVLQADKAALQQMARAEGEALAVVVRRILRESLTRRDLLCARQDNPATAAAGQAGQNAAAGEEMRRLQRAPEQGAVPAG